MPKRGEACYPLLINCKNIVVLPDEAHGSYYSFHAVLEKETRHFRYGYAKHKRDALPVAIFVGFTGKPIESYDRNTRAVFGDYVSICDIRDAVTDGATMPRYYESHLAKFDINRVEIAKFNIEIEELFEDVEDIAFREKAKSRWPILEKLVGVEQLLKEVAENLIKHFEVRDNIIEGLDTIVCKSREIYVHLYNAFIALKQES
jgi:type I restriction enzyme R subunit